MVTPEALADTLDCRPLTPDEIDEIANQFGWSTAPIIYETESGIKYATTWFCFRPYEDLPDDKFDTEIEGDALAFTFDSESGEWEGFVEQSDVTINEWMEVCELTAKYMGLDASLNKLEFEFGDGETVTRTLE